MSKVVKLLRWGKKTNQHRVSMTDFFITYQRLIEPKSKTKQQRVLTIENETSEIN